MTDLIVDTNDKQGFGVFQNSETFFQPHNLIRKRKKPEIRTQEGLLLNFTANVNQNGSFCQILFEKKEK